MLSSRRHGFTFLELAVVVTIIGIIVAITVPRFGSSFSKATLGGSCRHLAGTMAYLRNAAARDGRSYFLNIDLDNNEYWVTVFNEEADLSQIDYQDLDFVDEEVVYTEFSDAFVSKTRLQKQIALERVILQDGAKVFEGVVRIEFRPDGTADETVVNLSSPGERVYTVHLEYYNGQARVYKQRLDLDDLSPPLQLTEREPPRRPGDEL